MLDCFPPLAHLLRMLVEPYMRMLDADCEGADWREASRIVLLAPPNG
jgi:hypothetical protein